MDKIYLKKMKDRDLVIIIQDNTTTRKDFNLASEVLLERYEPQIHKNWWKLRGQLNGSSIVESLKDEYYSEAYEAFFTAIRKIDLAKIRDDNWKLVGYADFYLRNVRAKLCKQCLKMAKSKPLDSMIDINEDSRLSADPDVELAYQESEGFKDIPEYLCIKNDEENRVNNIVKKVYEGWNEKRKFIFRELMKGKTKATIARELNIKNMVIYNNCLKMKEDLKKAFGKN